MSSIVVCFDTFLKSSLMSVLLIKQMALSSSKLSAFVSKKRRSESQLAMASDVDGDGYVGKSSSTS